MIIRLFWRNQNFARNDLNKKGEEPVHNSRLEIVPENDQKPHKNISHVYGNREAIVSPQDQGIDIF